jgi:streptogramin lyase
MWMLNTLGSAVERVDTNGNATAYPNQSTTGCACHTFQTSTQAITVGPDHALWVANADYNEIDRYTTAGAFSSFTNSTVNDPQSITVGPDGNLWFTNEGNNSIGRITPSGTITNYPGQAVQAPIGITNGPLGELWFTSSGNNRIGAINTGGAIITLPATGSNGPGAIIDGPDGALWFTNSRINSIERAAFVGGSLVFSSYSDASTVSPTGISAGPDGGIWYASPYGNDYRGAIGEITPPPYAAVTPTAGPAGTTVTITGSGYTAGETVTVKYKTGATPATVTLCTTSANAIGDFACSAAIPTSAGATGAHEIDATGTNSRLIETTTYTLQ